MSFKAKNLDSSETCLPVTIQILGKHSLRLPRSTHPTPRPALGARMFPNVFSWVTAAPSSLARRLKTVQVSGATLISRLGGLRRRTKGHAPVTSRGGYRAWRSRFKTYSGDVESKMRIPRSGELEWVQARLAGSGPKGARVGRSRRDECVRRGSAGGSGGGGEESARESGALGQSGRSCQWRLGSNVPRALDLTEDKVVFLFFVFSGLDVVWGAVEAKCRPLCVEHSCLCFGTDLKS